MVQELNFLIFILHTAAVIIVFLPFHVFFGHYLSEVLEPLYYLSS